jgi:hypothetical protein
MFSGKDILIRAGGLQKVVDAAKDFVVTSSITKNFNKVPPGYYSVAEYFFTGGVIWLTKKLVLEEEKKESPPDKSEVILARCTAWCRERNNKLYLDPKELYEFVVKERKDESADWLRVFFLGFTKDMLSIANELSDKIKVLAEESEDTEEEK